MKGRAHLMTRRSLVGLMAAAVLARPAVAAQAEEAVAIALRILDDVVDLNLRVMSAEIVVKADGVLAQVVMRGRQRHAEPRPGVCQ